MAAFELGDLCCSNVGCWLVKTEGAWEKPRHETEWSFNSHVTVNGLVTSEGEFWRGQRKLVQPAFHRRRLDALFNMMVERTNDCVARFRSAADSSEAVDLSTPLSELTLDRLRLSRVERLA